MADLQLDSLEIKGFRGFRHLQVSKLGRVNLVVGKNNVGKTSLLEAVRLYAQLGSPGLIWALLSARDESTHRRSTFTSRMDYRVDVEEQALTAIKHLFYGRKDLRQNGKSIQIGPLRLRTKTLSIAVDWSRDQLPGTRQGLTATTETNRDNEFDNVTPMLAIRVGQLLSVDVPLNPEASFRLGRASTASTEDSNLGEVPNIFISANGLDKSEVGRLWDAINLTNLQEEVRKSLGIIAPQVTGVSLLVEERIPIVRVKSLDSPIPLRSMGEGMNRVFTVALALVNAKDGLLLVDEIENGIHYSVQPDVWRLIFRVARQLNVQVFATSHSWDCIEAFQKAANDETREEGMLIRLEERAGDIAATLFTEEELMIATRSQIEVR